MVPHQKRLATLQAEDALLGIAVSVEVDLQNRPDYIASRWALTRAFDTLESLAAWLRDLIVEAPHARQK
jgi:hypothetical protein